MLHALLLTLSLMQDGDPARAIRQIVASEFKHHADSEALAARLYDLWRRLPPQMARQGLQQIAGNSRGIIGALQGIDVHRGRAGEVYEKLTLPPSYYQHLYAVAEQFVTAELRSAAGFKPQPPAVRSAIESQFDLIMDEAQRLLGARFTGEGAARIVRELVDERRAAFKSDINLPWAPTPRPLTGLELREVIDAVATAVAKCEPVRIGEYDPKQHDPLLVLIAESTGELDSAGAAIQGARKSVQEALLALQRINDILKPELSTLRAERRRILAEAHAFVRDAEVREKDALQAIRREQALVAYRNSPHRLAVEARAIENPGAGACEPPSASEEARKAAAAAPEKQSRTTYYFAGGALLAVGLAILLRRLGRATAA